ncbi:MAG: type IV pilus modification protein PilV [Alcaligenaceae bacterium]|nr:MAG: type IV pilus modification protein PilV [Alcaligenaceae bacterium]
MTPNNFQKQNQYGVTLIESLVAIVIAALGILGILGVQMRTLSDTTTTVRRAQAIRLIEDLSERLKAHPNALMSLSDYAAAWTTPSTAVGDPAANCATSACSSQQLTVYDVATWRRSVQQQLPLGDATIFLAPGDDATNRRQLGILIRWRENERAIVDATDKKTYRDNIDATNVRAADGTLSAGAGAAAACTADFTCHLQYIPVSARCAPYDAGGGLKQFYCAGE